MRFQFSTPARFFAALAADTTPLPLFVGELQQHAIGCYSVHRPVKVAMRRAEHLLFQAEMARGEASGTKGGKTPELARAWQKVCFHHFHDTLGGTCLPSAYREVEADLGMAAAAAEETAAFAIRERFARLDPDPAQRVALFNASERPFDDFVEIEPWLEWTPWQRTWKLVDENGADVPYQEMASEGAGNVQARLLILIQLGPSESKILRVVDPQTLPSPKAGATSVFNSTSSSLQLKSGLTINLGPQPFIAFPDAGSFSLPQLVAFDDPSDTWSHGLSRYERKNPEAAEWSEPIPEDRGPLMESLFQNGSIGRTEIHAEWRLYRDQPWIECRLRVTWAEKHRILKLEWNLPSEIVRRTDGIMGGCIERAPDGRELPMRDWTRLTLQGDSGAATVAIVAPEVFALDCTSRRVSLTLLRSSVMACHDPNPGNHPRRIFSDRGEHHFRFRFLAGKLDSAYLDDIAMAWQRPLLSCEITRGMKTRAQRGAYAPLSF
jgi:alpha-mannosidase